MAVWLTLQTFAFNFSQPVIPAQKCSRRGQRNSDNYPQFWVIISCPSSRAKRSTFWRSRCASRSFDAVNVESFVLLKGRFRQNASFNKLMVNVVLGYLANSRKPNERLLGSWYSCLVRNLGIDVSWPKFGFIKNFQRFFNYNLISNTTPSDAFLRTNCQFNFEDIAIVSKWLDSYMPHEISQASLQQPNWSTLRPEHFSATSAFASQPRLPSTTGKTRLT